MNRRAAIGAVAAAALTPAFARAQVASLEIFSVTDAGDGDDQLARAVTEGLNATRLLPIAGPVSGTTTPTCAEPAFHPTVVWVNAPSLGGPGSVQDWVKMTSGFPGIGTQLLIQAKAVGITVVWTAVVALIAFKLADLIVGLRVSEEQEREGLDISSHGESAYDH
jgi:hypothetical protein